MREHRALRRALAVMIALTAIVIAAFLLLQTRGGPSRNSLRSYYMEATLEIVPQDETLLADSPYDRIVVSYEAPASFRREYRHDDPALAYLSTVFVSDGETLWQYDGLTNTYTYTDVTEEMRWYADSIIGGFLLGRLPAESTEAFLETLIQPGGTYDVRDQTTVLDRRVDVIDYSVRSGPTSTIWVDREYDFVLRYEQAGRGVRAEATRFEPNVDLPASRFSFEPPPGALGYEGSPQGTSNSGSLGSGPGINVLTPPGFRAPAYLPDGYTARGSSASQSPDGRTTQFGVNYERRDGSGAYVHLREVKRAGGLPSVLRTTERVSVNGVEAFASRSAQESRLAWYDGALLVMLASNTESTESLIAIAESIP